jgi:hypothetical protein
MYFISDLVCKFFIESNTLQVSDIESQPWFFNDYNLDPSIQNMLEAMKIIEEEIGTVDAKDFGVYLIDKLSFIYYDMENRKNGEETFVVINTTGEPLSTTENLKPLLISAQPKELREKCSHLWEEWETWFWKHRHGNGKKETDTADNGLKEFFRWITLLKTTDIQDTGDFQSVTKMSFEDIDKYFRIVKDLFENENLFKREIDWLASGKEGNEPKDWFKLLPVIEYLKRYGSADERKIIRVKIFFEHLLLIRNVSKAVGSLLSESINLIKNLPNDDIASIIKLENVSKHILTDEEKAKFELYLNPKYNREELENLFWAAEKHEIWRGEILSLIHWATKHKVFNVNLFKKYDSTFCKLFHDDTLKYPELDITRRALLTRDLEKYPKIFRGYTNHSFCWFPSDWQTLINENELAFGLFLKELIDVENIYDSMDIMIKNNPTGKKYDEFVKDKRLLEYCANKNIQWREDVGWILLKGEKTSREHANLKSYCFYLDLLDKKHFGNSEKWTLKFYEREETCVALESENIEININLCENDPSCKNDSYQLQIFIKNEDKRKKYLSDDIVRNFQLTWNRKWKRYESESKNRKEIEKLLKQMMKIL